MFTVEEHFFGCDVASSALKLQADGRLTVACNVGIGEDEPFFFVDYKASASPTSCGFVIFNKSVFEICLDEDRRIGCLFNQLLSSVRYTLYWRGTNNEYSDNPK